MYINLVAGERTIAAVYARKLVESGINFPDALAIWASALLCGSIGAREGTNEYDLARELYMKYIQKMGNKSFAQTGINLLKFRASPLDAWDVMKANQKNGIFMRPGIENVPVLPSNIAITKTSIGKSAIIMSEMRQINRPVSFKEKVKYFDKFSSTLNPVSKLENIRRNN